MPIRDDLLTAIAVVVLLAAAALAFYDFDLAGIALASAPVLGGAVGILRRRITLGGRSRRSFRTYVGAEAVFVSALFMLPGLVIIVLSVHKRWPYLLPFP